MNDERTFESLKAYLAKIPGVAGTIGSGFGDDGRWWVKFSLDIDHPLAWRVVQELGHVLNYMSLQDRLPTAFMPVSPPPYLNGGPREFLSWVIESKDRNFKPGTCAKWLEDRLPRPVDDLNQWKADDS
jgi:hypothetical protein